MIVLARGALLDLAVEVFRVGVEGTAQILFHGNKGRRGCHGSSFAHHLNPNQFLYGCTFGHARFTEGQPIRPFKALFGDRADMYNRGVCGEPMRIALKSKPTTLAMSFSLALLLVGAIALPAQDTPPVAVNPSSMPKLGTVDPRFVSYNVEMVEVTGGRFWKPYKSATETQAAKPATAGNANQPPGMSSDLYQYRPPINLANPRLRKLAEAFGPSYVRVSGTWQNSTYFQNSDQAPTAEAPKGFKGVLTRAEWKGVVDFAHAVDDEIVTSFAVSAGTRANDEAWTSSQAKEFVDYTRSIGGHLAAAEFMNEPTFPVIGGAPADYDAAAFARDAKQFATFLKKESPQTVFLGPGGVGEGVSLTPPGMKLLGSPDLMQATGGIFDAFSYHFYGTVSSRCMGKMSGDKALTAEWLDRTDGAEKFYANLRDKYLPGKNLWLTETAEAACGGDAFAAQFVDVFRYLNQLGTLAQKNVQVVMHNTLAASDYGLLNEETLQPRPDFWAGLLWKRTMGDVVLDPGTPKDEGLRIYAHCSKEGKGGVTLVALNTDAEHDQALSIPSNYAKLVLTAPDLASSKSLLNGKELEAGTDGTIELPKAENAKKGVLRIVPASAAFLTIADAHNKSCN